MLAPKKTKHRKAMKGRLKGIASAGTTVSFGSFGLKSLENAWVTARQIEAARRVIAGFLKRSGKTWIRIFPDKPVTSKSAEVPMGGGKGAVEYYVAVVKPGMILFEIDGVSVTDAHKALTLAGHKLPVTTKIVGK